MSIGSSGRSGIAIRMPGRTRLARVAYTRPCRHGRSLSACRHYDQRQSAARSTRTRTQTRGRKMENEPIKSTVKAFILAEFLPGERPEALTEDTPMVTEGVHDSLATMRLVRFLEKEYDMAKEPQE